MGWATSHIGCGEVNRSSFAREEIRCRAKSTHGQRAARSRLEQSGFLRNFRQPVERLANRMQSPLASASYSVATRQSRSRADLRPSPRVSSRGVADRAGLSGSGDPTGVGTDGEIPMGDRRGRIDGRLWDPSVAVVVYGSSTIRAATRPASTSAMASLTWSSGRVSRITRVLPAA